MDPSSFCAHPLLLFKQGKGKGKQKEAGGAWCYLWLSGSPPCQRRMQFLQEGVSEIELTLHLNELFLVAYSLSS